MSYIPSREAELLGWSTNFDSKINADPTIYGLTIEQAGEYNTLHNAYRTAYQVAIEPDTRTQSTIIAKNDAKKALIQKARELAQIVQKYPGTTNVMRSDLGITVPDDEPTPVPVPEDPPAVEIKSRYGKTATLRMHDVNNSTKRGKPPYVTGASVFSFVGEEAPDDLGQWKFEGNTGKTEVEVTFPPMVPGGSKVWFTAFWFNSRKESGPASAPVSARLGDGLSQAA